MDNIERKALEIIGKGGQLTSVYIPHNSNGEHEVRFKRDRLFDLIVKALREAAEPPCSN